MRRTLSIQAWRALFGTVPRALTVIGILAAYFLVATVIEPFVPWWSTTLVGLLVIVFFAYLGSRWLDRDLMRRGEISDRERE
ncbi:MAG: hypothetical protein K0S49_2165 [Microbacterium sp.]|jgi:membrane protein implicated in regulation of membrane protease activity|nr:hypothetical protein [Microbacterium sp.]MDF2919118.1 hypothetical protein [Microbacterium sp.]